MPDKLDILFEQIRHCQHCCDTLDPNPVIRGSSHARLLIIGQAPGTKVHASGIPWNDPSGDRLRHWLQLDKQQFYNQDKLAIMPMGFCYPGKGKSGDLPPDPRCAPRWHDKVLRLLPNIELTLLVGLYAQKYYLKSQCRKTLTETVKNWREMPEGYFPLPHPSPRNTFWLKRNPWFEDEIIPVLRTRLNQIGL